MLAVLRSRIAITECKPYISTITCISINAEAGSNSTTWVRLAVCSLLLELWTVQLALALIWVYCSRRY
jgi:hypothetical protein